MATRRRGVTRSRITTRSSKTKQPERDHDQEQATTASQTSIIRNTSFLMMSSPEPCSPSQMKKSGETEDKKIGEEEEEGDDSNGCWSTPKAKRFRIPEIESCPPAPKKQRTAANDDGNYCLMRRSSIPFFTQPDQLDEFFFRATVSNMSTA